MNNSASFYARLTALWTCATCLFAPAFLFAADGTWTAATDGSWDTPGNWSPAIADGSGFTATFGPISTTTPATITITVDTARTIGALSFQSTTGNTHNFVVGGTKTLTLAGGSTPTVTVNLISRAATISAALDGNQGLNVTNTTGSLTLSGDNIYTGVTNVTSGVLIVGSNTALGASGTGNETIVGNSGTLMLSDGVKVSGETVGLGSASSTSGTLQASGSAEWAGSILINNSNARVGTANGSSRLTISGVIGNGTNNNLIVSGVGTTVLSGVNTYTGGTTLYRGTLMLDGGDNRLPTGTALSMGGTTNDSTFDLNGYNQQLTALLTGSSISSRTVTNLSGTASVLTLDGTTDRSFFSSTATTAITGNLSLVKAGTFNQTLANTNTYTGNTTINAGTLTLSSGSTMTFFIGANGVNNRILGTGALALDGTFIFDLTNAGTTNGNSWLVADFSHLTESIGGTFAVQDFTKSGNTWTSGNYSFSELTGTLTYSTGAIPEPSASATLAGLLVMGACVLRRRRHTRSDK